MSEELGGQYVELYDFPDRPLEVRWKGDSLSYRVFAKDQRVSHTAIVEIREWVTCHKRFTRWAAMGVRDRVFAGLLKDREKRYIMIDSSVVRAHQQAATALKKGFRRSL